MSAPVFPGEVNNNVNLVAQTNRKTCSEKVISVVCTVAYKAMTAIQNYGRATPSDPGFLLRSYRRLPDPIRISVGSAYHALYSRAMIGGNYTFSLEESRFDPRTGELVEGKADRDALERAKEYKNFF